MVSCTQVQGTGTLGSSRMLNWGSVVVRESFIAQYLEEQRLKPQPTGNAISYRSNGYRGHSSKTRKPKRKPKSRRQKKNGKSGCRLCDIIGLMLGEEKITRQTSFMCALKLLGFASYSAYLKSPLWRAVKSKVIKVKGDTCFLCHRQADTVHHRK